MVPILLDIAAGHGFTPSVAALDQGYDTESLYDRLEARGIRPLISLGKTPAVKAGNATPRSCDHGARTSPDPTPSAARPNGAARPVNGPRVRMGQGISAPHPHPAQHPRRKSYYHQRGAVERESGRLKNECAMLPAASPATRTGPPPRGPDQLRPARHRTIPRGPRSTRILSS